jgi:hypothetical protein
MDCDIARVLLAGLYTLNLAESAGESRELARSYGSMCAVAGLVPLHRLARAYARMAEAARKRAADPAADLWVGMMAGVYGRQVADWEGAQRELEAGMELARELGEWRHWQEMSGILADTHLFRGEFERARRLWAEAREVAARTGDAQARAWVMLGPADARLGRGGPGHAAEVIALLRRMLDDVGERFADERMWALGLLAHAYLRNGEAMLAREAAEQAQEMIESRRAMLAYTVDSYVGTAAVFLDLWARHPGDRDVARRARRACRALRRFARVCPFAWPRAWRCEGRARWLAGRRKAARRAWTRSLEAAQQYAMPYDEGLAHLEIGRHLPAGDPAREAHLEHARRRLGELVAEYDLHEAELAGLPDR